MKAQKQTRFEDLPLEKREDFAEHTKERIYSTITLLALITALWHGAAHHTPGGVIISILSTAVALWLATLMSARMSYRAVHGTSIPAKKHRQFSQAASGLLAPAIAPIILVGLSALNIIELKAALFVSLVVLVISLLLFSLIGSRRIYDSWNKIIFISLGEAGIGVGIIALKLLAGE